MPYKLAPGNSPISVNSQFVGTDGITYTSSWWNGKTEAERNAVGITWEADPAWYDQQFYWGVDNPKDITELKKLWVEKQKEIANSLLRPTDWMVIRAAEGGTAVPSATTTYRSNVRTQCELREATINACADTDALCATIRNAISPTVAGTASNGATEKFDTSKEKLDESGNSFDPKQYESFDPKQYNDIANPDLLEDWPTAP